MFNKDQLWEAILHSPSAHSEHHILSVSYWNNPTYRQLITPVWYVPGSRIVTCTTVAWFRQITFRNYHRALHSHCAQTYHGIFLFNLSSFHYCRTWSDHKDATFISWEIVLMFFKRFMFYYFLSARTLYCFLAYDVSLASDCRGEKVKLRTKFECGRNAKFGGNFRTRWEYKTRW
jgi:hypothetical protein